MKKNYFLTLLLTFFIAGFSFGQTPIFINEIHYDDVSTDNNEGVEVAGPANTDLTGYKLLFYNGSSSSKKVYKTETLSGTISDQQNGYGTLWFAVSGLQNGAPDGVALVNASDTVLQFLSYEGSFTAADGAANGMTSTDIGVAETTSTPNGQSLQLTGSGTAYENFSWVAPATATAGAINNGQTLGGTATPSLSITTPTEGQVFPSTDTSVAVNITVNNFTFSADNGSGMGDSSGDGFIKQTLVTPAGTFNENKFDASVQMVNVAPGESYTVTMELVDNAGASLSPAVSKTVNFSVAFPCDLQLGAITKTCDATTSGTDTYTASIAYTGGATSTYTLNTDMGNISGNNPSTEASGTITILNIPEGTNIVFTANGDASNSSCSLTRNISSPTCKVFPVYEPFDYTAGTNLIASADWQNSSTSSDEIQVVTATITNPYNAGEYPDPVGNMINFAGVGSDSYIGFNNATAGTIYASFLYTPTDMSTVTDSNGAYWGGLMNTTGSFVARLWVKPDATDAAKFNVGVSFTSNTSDIVYHTAAYTAGDIMFMVIGYDLDTDLVSVWVNPNASTFEGASAPTATFTKASADATSLGRFFIRQDSNAKTANTNFDELRIGNTWAQVTPKNPVASINNNSIVGFGAYPNPVDNQELTIRTSSSDTKEVTLYNVLGRKVLSQNFSGNQKVIDVSSINSGIYILKVVENGKISTKKLVVK